jgi:hypothetical protein
VCSLFLRERVRVRAAGQARRLEFPSRVIKVSLLGKFLSQQGATDRLDFPHLTLSRGERGQAWAGRTLADLIFSGIEAQTVKRRLTP